MTTFGDTPGTPVFAGPHYLVAPDGTHCYPILNATRLVVPDGARVVAGMKVDSYRSPNCMWLVAPGPVESVTFAGIDGRESAGHTLIDADAASAKFPAHLTDAEWRERGFGNEDDPDGYMATRIYRHDWRVIPGAPTTHLTSGLTEIPGTVDEHPDRPWTADQPMSLVYSRNYHHLFPGRMHGFREAVLEALTAEYGQKTGYLNSTGALYDWNGSHGKQIEVTLRLDYDTPQWATQEKRTRGGRKSRVTEKVKRTRDVVVNVNLGKGTYIEAASKAEAVEKFDRAVTAWVEWVRSHRMTVCSHCDGHGAVSTSGAQP